MTAHTHDPALAEAVAQTRRMIQSLVEEDCRAWELTDAELAVVVEAARPAIRREVLEEAATELDLRAFNTLADVIRALMEK
jgi:hypothetical protein